MAGESQTHARIHACMQAHSTHTHTQTETHRWTQTNRHTQTQTYTETQTQTQTLKHSKITYTNNQLNEWFSIGQNIILRLTVWQGQANVQGRAEFILMTVNVDISWYDTWKNDANFVMLAEEPREHWYKSRGVEHLDPTCTFKLHNVLILRH